MKFAKKIAFKSLSSMTNFAINNGRLRHWLIRNMEGQIYKDLIKENPDNRPLKVQEDKYYMGRAIFRSIDRAIEKGNLSGESIKGLLHVFLGNVFFGGFYQRMNYLEKYGDRPPVFMTLSPEKQCNLRCKGCYAASGAEFKEKLSWDVLTKIIDQGRELWGMRFFVISGGEPLLYRDNGNTIFDLYKKYDDSYFLMYTNGTLINKEVAKKMAELGNITPAISVEGMKKETDWRRGKGVFEKIIRAMGNLKEAGIPFGISVTATRNNLDVITSDKFRDFFFHKMGAIYGWIFQYMPIGREYTLEIMPTPEERTKLFEWEWRLLRKEDIFVADFWSTATASDGCIAGARPGGYFYIDWNGNVMPCVFVPYTVDNVNEVFKKGGDLNDIIHSDFFKSIREWQFDYAYKKPPEEHGNWIIPCFIRDHHRKFLEVAEKYNVKPADKDAALALKDPGYNEGLIKYDKEMKKLTEPAWNCHYLKPNREKIKKGKALLTQNDE
ncbi:MAG: radical SAM protein [candidate division WOR-3 bacterium]|nr:radical SAM protein [candidate division WOR-3 bacterium]